MSKPQLYSTNKKTEKSTNTEQKNTKTKSKPKIDQERGGGEEALLPQDKNENHKSLILVYWSGFLLFWTISKLSIEFDMYFPQAFQANASSPRNEQSVNQQIYF